jgi:hypothetical protein
MAQNKGGRMTLNNCRRANRYAGFVLCSLAGLLVSGQAQAKPNFSGEWKLNASKSQFAPMPAPEKRMDKITHADPSLKDSITQSGPNGEGTIDFKYATDGSETTNDVRGNPMKSTAKWDGDTLVVNTKASFGGMEITLADKWTLSEDGKVLTIARHIVSPQGELDQKIVLEKQ